MDFGDLISAGLIAYGDYANQGSSPQPQPTQPATTAQPDQLSATDQALIYVLLGIGVLIAGLFAFLIATRD